MERDLRTKDILTLGPPPIVLLATSSHAAIHEFWFTYHNSGNLSPVTDYLRTICTFPHSTGLPEDAVVNTFSWIGNHAGGRDSSASLIKTALDTFYAAVKTYLSSQYSWNSGTYEHIDMSDAKPRVPFASQTAALGTLNTAANDFPSEVAWCCSMRGATGSGLNMKRRRGRIYLGPLQFNSLDLPIQGSATTDAVATAFAALKTVTQTKLAIYSPYTHHAVPVGQNIKDYPNEVPSLLDDSFVEVVAVWVDNAFDTQRRRGVKSTYRKTL